MTLASHLMCLLMNNRSLETMSLKIAVLLAFILLNICWFHHDVRTHELRIYKLLSKKVVIK